MPATTEECQRILGVDTQPYNQNMCMSGRFPRLAIYVNIFNVSAYACLYVNIHVYVCVDMYIYLRYIYIYIFSSFVCIYIIMTDYIEFALFQPFGCGQKKKT